MSDQCYKHGFRDCQFCRPPASHPMSPTDPTPATPPPAAQPPNAVRCDKFNTPMTHPGGLPDARWDCPKCDAEIGKAFGDGRDSRAPEVVRLTADLTAQRDAAMHTAKATALARDALRDQLARAKAERDEAVREISELSMIASNVEHHRDELASQLTTAHATIERLTGAIPTHGEYGGPLVRIAAKYEDGSEQSIDWSAKLRAALTPTATKPAGGTSDHPTPPPSQGDAT